MKKIIPILLLNLLWFSCNEEPGERQYNEGTLPANPVNLSVMNTEYDDYNSTPSTVGLYFRCASHQTGIARGQILILFINCLKYGLI